MASRRQGRRRGPHPAARDDVANLALFLASDESASMTGTVLPLDGGLSAALVPRFSPPAG